jgi:hypothetical protein
MFKDVNKYYFSYDYIYMSYMEAPTTPPRNKNVGMGDFDFSDVYGKKNGAINNTPERKIIPTKRGNLPPSNFAQWSNMIPAKKKGGKPRKHKTRKTRSRKHNKSHKKTNRKSKKSTRKSKKSRK